MLAVKSSIGRVLDRLFPRAWLAFRILRRDRHFESEFWLIPEFCDRSHAAIDVGANEGEFSYFMARFAKAVVAFEPNVDLVGRLRRRVKGRAQVHEVALSRAPGVTEFRHIARNTGIATIERNNALAAVTDRQSIQTRAVEMRTLDSYGFEDVSFIKIDVEGHEEAVIEGAEETLRRNRPALLIESEDRHNPGAPGRLKARLEALGYKGFILSCGRLEEIAEQGLDGRKNYNFVYLSPESDAFRRLVSGR